MSRLNWMGSAPGTAGVRGKPTPTSNTAHTKEREEADFMAAGWDSREQSQKSAQGYASAYVSVAAAIPIEKVCTVKDKFCAPANRAEASRHPRPLVSSFYGTSENDRRLKMPPSLGALPSRRRGWSSQATEFRDTQPSPAGSQRSQAPASPQLGLNCSHQAFPGVPFSLSPFHLSLVPFTLSLPLIP